VLESEIFGGALGASGSSAMAKLDARRRADATK